MSFGFSLNLATSDPNKLISFNEAIAPGSGAGPFTCLYLYYSVDRAKEMLAQLQTAITRAEIAIAKAEATINDLPE